MGLLAGLARLLPGRSRPEPRRTGRDSEQLRRHRRFESMEPRRMLAADPLQIGAVFIEEDLGSDLHGDTFEITFEGGAAGTQLTRIVINGDQDDPGFGEGDVFFDTESGGLGADNAFPFTLVSLSTQDPAAEVHFSVQDGTSVLAVDFVGFRAGDKLAFTIDVDEAEDFDPAETDPQLIADGLDPITSGVEFQGSLFTAHFTAPHYHDVAGSGQFRNRYDDLLAGTGLDLPPDDFQGKRDRTDGVVVQLQQEPLPVTISGTVYLDHDLDLVQDDGEGGLEQVELSLWKREGADYVFTGHTTQTDVRGDYTFGQELDLKPGVFQVREVQPGGLFSVGSVPGTVAGSASGEILAGDPDVLTSIELLLGGQNAIDFDFAEARPVSISGHVYHDRNNDGVRDAGEEGIANIAVQVVPVDTVAAQQAVTVTTGDDGAYTAANLAPGLYRVVEADQPAGFFDGLDAAGTVAGQPRGRAVNPGDRLEEILLLGGDAGLEYNFGELAPASIQGRVHLSDPDGDCFGVNVLHPPLPDVTLRLLDAGGNIVAETRTDADGRYRFDDLLPGVYTVIEVTPDGLIDGGEQVGRVDAAVTGMILQSDVISGIVLLAGQSGEHYDFCEHLPASVSGLVYHDANNSGVLDADEAPIAGVELALLDEAGNVIGSELTDDQGFYRFSALEVGQYTLRETHPAGWIDGRDAAGTVGGVVVGAALEPGDEIQQVVLRWGDEGVHYNFGEILPASIRGRVQLSDPDGDCFGDHVDHRPVEGASVLLLNDLGQTIAETQTDAGGQYVFAGLLPGSYTVVEQTPAGLIDGDEHVGQIDGVTVGERVGNDTIRAIVLSSGQHAVDYDFCEHEPVMLAGHVYHDRNDNGSRDAGEEPIPGALVELRDDTGGIVAMAATDDSGSYRFSELRAGDYTIVERQPDAWLDGRDTAGTVDSVAVGQAINPGDEIRQVALKWGQGGVDYDFGELLPGSISGLVHSDPNRNCRLDEGEAPIAGVTIQLLDSRGETVATTATDRFGRYAFTGLAPGVYTVVEQQPDGFLHGGQRAGSGGGDESQPDRITQIRLGSGQQLVDYDFCELPPASIGGLVHVDPDNDCRLDLGETRLEGVVIELLNDRGEVVAATQTNADGRYRFEDLAPGRYSIREHQPDGYFDGGQRLGPGGGDASVNDLLTLDLGAGQDLIDYSFCELPPASLSGFVFQDGPVILTSDGLPPANLFQIRDGVRSPDDVPIAGVVLELRDGLSGEPIQGDVALPGYHAAGPIRTVTDAGGFYEFAGIPGGRSYAVYQIHPEGFVDSLDTPGTTSGVAINPRDSVPQFILNRLVESPRNDAIVLIPVGIGASSEDNNFSEVRVVGEPRVPQLPPAPPPSLSLPPVFTPPLLVTPPLPAAFVPPVREIPLFGGGGVAYTWHLSVINAGTPRGVDWADETDVALWGTAPYLDVTQWQPQRLRDAQWMILQDTAGEEVHIQLLDFGIGGGTPVVGDFNGDGLDELGVFYQGEWFIDLNGDGVWDARDLWARLGDQHDRPVTGDWDGDGKDDIGIFGPQWPQDLPAIRAEPGLPDPYNISRDRPKNLPPQPDEATAGYRLLQLNASGPRRADLIDHVFRFGTARDIPLAGDWNGDGIRSIGVFRDGRWRLDIDGDGRWTDRDAVANFGQAGDLPLVGDFDGNGVDDIGVYRGGQWYLDVNRNRELDAHDKFFEMGGAADLPVVGDWDGDGVDQPGLYRASPSHDPKL